MEALHQALGKALGARLGHPAGQHILRPRMGSVSVLGTQLQATRLVWKVEGPPMSSLFLRLLPLLDNTVPVGKGQPAGGLADTGLSNLRPADRGWPWGG